MTEQDIQIPTSDGMYIHGRLIDNSSETLVIVSHGLTHDMFQLVPTSLAQKLSDYPCDVLRYSFYGAGTQDKPARKLYSCSMADHVNDFLTVIQWAKETGKYKSVVQINHSLAGLVMLAAAENNANVINAKLDKAIFIDPSWDVKSFWDSFPGVLTGSQDSGSIHLNYNQRFVLAKSFVDEIIRLDGKTCLSLAEKIKIPAVIFEPSETISKPSPQEYRFDAFQKVWGNKLDIVKVDNADHRFSRIGNIPFLCDRIVGIIQSNVLKT